MSQRLVEKARTVERSVNASRPLRTGAEKRSAGCGRSLSTRAPISSTGFVSAELHLDRPLLSLRLGDTLDCPPGRLGDTEKHSASELLDVEVDSFPGLKESLSTTTVRLQEPEVHTCFLKDHEALTALTAMAELELEIDQSHLPRVQEVRQNFAVLEDGVLAHSLQEQEIEKYYMTNIQKNQLVQNDIRVAKQLQDEEEEHRAQDSALSRQASRQLEEQDFEYARVIQEEIQRCAEEARRRELDDEELAKQIQEQEEQTRRRTREGSSSGSDAHSPHSQQQYSPTSSRGQCSPSQPLSSQLDCPQAGSPRALRTNPCLRSSEGHSYRDCGDRLSGESEGSDTVFSERSWGRTNRGSRVDAVPPPLLPRDRNCRSFPEYNYESDHCSENGRVQRSLVFHRSFPEYNYERDPCNENGRVQRSLVFHRSFPEYNYERDPCNENGRAEGRRDRNYNLEKDHRGEPDGWHGNQELQREMSEVRDRRCSRTESARLPDRRRQSFREAAKTWAYRDNPDKHVHFREESSKARDRSSQDGVWEMLGQVLRDRGVPVRWGSSRAPLQIGAAQRRDRRDSQASCSDTPPHQRGFERALTARHSFHGDIRERRRPAPRNAITRVQTQDEHHEHVQPDRDLRRRDSDSSRQGSRRWTEQKSFGSEDRDVSDHRIRRTTSERRRPGGSEERDTENPNRRALHRSQSLRSRHRPPAERDRTSLELGELQQVLHDEELARKLQEEEERRSSRNTRPSPRNSCPEGDFRVAQVAQDEEIARYIQKQEVKSKRRSRELEGPVSWREHREMMSQHDRRARERPVPRERLDSEGLPSPTDDCSPEEQPHSPSSTLQPSSLGRNIAEELDPTFQARIPAPDALRPAQNDSSSCAPLPAQQSGFLEEPTFVPPTKRQVEKSVRPKSKEKRENCKQQ